MMNSISPSIVRVARLGAIALMGSLLFGCAAVKLPAPTASADNVQQLRSAAPAPLQAGKFALAAGKDAGMDKIQGGLRGSTVEAQSGSFSQYLKDQLLAELKAAGVYDERSTTVIEAQLTDSKLDAAIGTGTGRLAARFTVTRDGQKVYDKELAVSESWDSSFVGAVALPEAINRYGSFYRKLIAELFKDPEFRKAVAK
jgi:hypothetical protein